MVCASVLPLIALHSYDCNFILNYNIVLSWMRILVKHIQSREFVLRKYLNIDLDALILNQTDDIHHIQVVGLMILDLHYFG
jgi:hypothetical protein